MNKKNKLKIAVAMSGGVDSAVAAALLKKQGYDVVGVFMQFWKPEGEYTENRCCSLESWHEAQQIAKILDFPIYKINFGEKFKEKIVDEFLSEYKNGKTPNPCVSCNKFIKFNLLLNYVKVVFEADYLATGHYVKLEFDKKSKEYKLKRPKDKKKDQTYFLYNLKQDQLKYLLFPLANYNKDRVRQLAKKFKLPIHDKPDSQEICFVGNSHYDFLKSYLDLKSGRIVNRDNKNIGRHKGLPLYTLGQRTGLGLSGGPWYVVKMDQKKNILMVSRNANDELLKINKIYFKNTSWIGEKIKFPLKCEAQIRYRGKTIKCLVEKTDRGMTAIFRAPHQAPASGQSIVFYQGNELLGGGIIK
jgi:tRNA-uridine 2-sulfurtransferase